MWFDHVERVEKDRIAKRVYVGEFKKKRFGCQASMENDAG